MTYPEEAHKEVTAQNWPITFYVEVLILSFFLIYLVCP